MSNLMNYAKDFSTKKMMQDIEEKIQSYLSKEDKPVEPKGMLERKNSTNEIDGDSVVADSLADLITKASENKAKRYRGMNFKAERPKSSPEEINEFLSNMKEVNKIAPGFYYDKDDRNNPMNFSGSIVKEDRQTDALIDVSETALEQPVEAPTLDIAEAIEQDQVEQQDTYTLKGSQAGLMAKPSSASNTGGTSFLNFIGKGEGDYGSSNRGTKNNKIQGSTNNTERGSIKLTELTIEDIRKYQKIKDPDNADRLFAVGKYQLIPSTFERAVKGLGLPKNTVFNKETQEKIGRYLLFEKRPSLGAYIKGESNDEAKALLEASKEWASLPNPKTGNSYYGKGNKAQHTLKETKIALNKARNDYAKSKQD
tara:strand:+ start:2217 stop:3320 length:1104 start_codon:yes stop_codon:yes gene_type:complete